MPEASSDKSSKQKKKDGEICVFSPWPLFTITVESLSDEGDEVYFHAGGQGVWVARMVAGLDGCPILVGPVGGEARHVIEALVRAEGMDLRPVPVKGQNGGYINDRRGGKREEIASVRPPRLDRHEIDDLHNAALAEGIRCGTLVVTGIPDGEVMPVETYPRLVRDLKANGVIVVADVAGTVLEAIEEGLTLLKVSHEELQAAGLAKGDSDDVLMRAMEALRPKADHVVVSRAGAGCLALMDGKFYDARGPELDAHDHTGAGDSMTAALAVALSQGLKPEEALRLATAAGALNVTRHGRGTGKRTDIEALASSVEIKEVKR